MDGDVQDTFQAGRDAMRRHDWIEARRLLTAADAQKRLDPEGLRQLGKAHEWCRDMTSALDVFERSYAGFVAAGDSRAAAGVALMLRHLCTNMLRDVVIEGTGTKAEIPGYQVAGKTGTAAIPTPQGYSDSKYVSSFVGYVPAGNPQLLVLVTVDQPQGAIYGGMVAAPVFQAIAKFDLQYLEILPHQ